MVDSRFLFRNGSCQTFLDCGLELLPILTIEEPGAFFIYSSDANPSFVFAFLKDFDLYDV